MNDEVKANGAMKVTAIGNVSRETGMAERIATILMRRAEDLCSNASVLIDQTFLPLVILVEVFPQTEDGRRPLGQMFIAGPQGVDNTSITELLREINGTIARNMQAQAAQQGVTEGDDPETKLGDPADAAQAMEQALKDSE